MIEVKIYKAKNGAMFPKAKAQEIGEELDRIKDTNNGKLLAPDVLKEAQDANSVLHPYFDWDTERAANKWNLHQARMLINSIEIVIVNDETGEEKSGPAYINILDTSDKNTEMDEDEEVSKERAYIDVETVTSNESYRKQALDAAIQQAKHWKERYEWLKELAGVVKEINKLE